jgi:hypothetical protein
MVTCPHDAPDRPVWLVCQYLRAGSVSSEKHEVRWQQGKDEVVTLRA